MDGYIHSEPMPSRHHTSYIAAFERTIDFFTKLGRPPTFVSFDNETSRPFDTSMSRKGIAMQYCPPGMHCGRIGYTGPSPDPSDPTAYCTYTSLAQLLASSSLLVEVILASSLAS